MTSQTAICNLALQAMGTRSTIASIDEPSNEAENCKLLWNPLRDELLTMAYWGFARHTDILALLKSAPGTPEFSGSATEAWSKARPAPPWLYSYSQPSDCLRVRFVHGTYSGWPSDVTPIFPYSNSVVPISLGTPGLFAVSNDVDENNNEVTSILTNQSGAIVTYTRRVSNTELWSPQFVRAMTMLLASRLIMPLSGDKKLMGGMIDIVNAIVLEARLLDANEGLTVIDHVPEMLRVRDYTWANSSEGQFTLPYPPLFTV